MWGHPVGGARGRPATRPHSGRPSLYDPTSLSSLESGLNRLRKSHQSHRPTAAPLVAAASLAAQARGDQLGSLEIDLLAMQASRPSIQQFESEKIDDKAECGYRHNLASGALSSKKAPEETTKVESTSSGAVMYKQHAQAAQAAGRASHVNHSSNALSEQYQAELQQLQQQLVEAESRIAAAATDTETVQVKIVEVPVEVEKIVEVERLVEVEKIVEVPVAVDVAVDQFVEMRILQAELAAAQAIRHRAEEALSCVGHTRKQLVDQPNTERVEEHGEGFKGQCVTAVKCDDVTDKTAARLDHIVKDESTSSGADMYKQYAQGAQAAGRASHVNHSSETERVDEHIKTNSSADLNRSLLYSGNGADLLNRYNIIAICGNCSEISSLPPMLAASKLFPHCTDILTARIKQGAAVPGAAQLLDQVNDQRMACLYNAYSSGETEYGMGKSVSDTVRNGWLAAALEDLLAQLRAAGSVRVGILVNQQAIKQMSRDLAPIQESAVKMQLLGLSLSGEVHIVIPSNEWSGREESTVASSVKKAASSSAPTVRSLQKDSTVNAKQVTPRTELHNTRDQLHKAQQQQLTAEKALEEEIADRHREEELVATELAQLEAKIQRSEIKHSKQLEEAEANRAETERQLEQFKLDRVRDEELALTELNQMGQKAEHELQKATQDHQQELQQTKGSGAEHPETQKRLDTLGSPLTPPKRSSGWFS